MDVTPQELRGSEIKEAWRGYHRDEVDDLLERAAVTIENLARQMQEGGRLAPAAPAPAQMAPGPVPLPSSREDADMLQRTLLMAQRAADDAVAEAHAQARTLVDEAEAKAQSLVSEAESTARRIAEGERRRLEAEIQELSARREKLCTDADALDRYASGYRERLRAAIETDLASLGATVEPPTPRPQLQDVDVAYVTPQAVASDPAPVARPPVAPAPAMVEQPPGRDGGSSVQPSASIEAVPAPSAPSRVAPDSAGSSFTEPRVHGRPDAAPPTATAPLTARPPTGEWPPPAPVGEAVAAPGVEPASWLSEDEWAVEEDWETSPPWERATAQHAPFASEVPMEANPIDDGESLDDDAFFASLREAVRDDAALGQGRNDGALFEGEPEDDRRRFRRRR